MKIDDLTIGEAMKLVSLLNFSKKESGLNGMIGKKVLIRTYSAGVHFGELVEKSGKEVILKNARRLWYWKTINNGISLSEVANVGLHSDSKVSSEIKNIWLEAIEIIPCEDCAIKNIEGQNEYKA